MKTYKTAAFRLSLAAGVLLALAMPSAASADDADSYGYLRVVEGSARLSQDGSDERSAANEVDDKAEINQPVMAGDHLWVADHSHVEIVLADRNVLRVDGGSELVLERLAGSPDRDDQATVIRLIEGNLQLTVIEDSLGDELPRIDTPNATIYVQNYGTFRVTAEHDGWSQVVVRRGTAQVVTDDGRETVRADEEAVIDDNAVAENGDDHQAGIDIREAGAYDSLERWARRLDDEASAGDQQAYVDDNLRYQASSLNRYGSWIDVEGSRYWRPRVNADWRPYWQGRWVYTRAGLTWVSTEPWGWVPYHYGSWDFLPTYGWVWQPGYVWAPAWVYWYWGPSYVGWCPTGYYTSFYGSHFGADFGFRNGVYGWAGGDWGSFDRWSFVNAGYFRDGYRSGYRNGYRDGYWDGRRDVQRYAVRLDGDGRGRNLERGVITTDTKPLRPSTWQNEGSVLTALNVRPIGKPMNNGRERGGVAATGREMPDVTQFVARKPQLPTDIVRTVGSASPGTALNGTPLKPSTLGRRAERGQDSNGRTGGSKPATTWNRPGETAGSSKPGRVEVGGGNTGSSGNAGRPVDNGRPGAWERPGRPTGSADGGAPRPEATGKPGRPAPNADGGSPRPERGAKPDRSGESGSTWSRPTRPAPDADGGSPRPRTGSDEKPARPAERPATEDRRPPADNSSKPSWQRPPAESGEAAPRPERSPRQEKPREEKKPREKTPPPPEREQVQSWRSVDRQDAYERPEAARPEPVRPQPAERYSRPSQSERPVYQAPSRPEPRPERAAPPPPQQQTREKPAQEARPSSPPPQQQKSRSENSRPPARQSKPRDDGN